MNFFKFVQFGDAQNKSKGVNYSHYYGLPSDTKQIFRTTCLRCKGTHRAPFDDNHRYCLDRFCGSSLRPFKKYRGSFSFVSKWTDGLKRKYPYIYIQKGNPICLHKMFESWLLLRPNLRSTYDFSDNFHFAFHKRTCEYWQVDFLTWVSRFKGLRAPERRQCIRARSPLCFSRQNQRYEYLGYWISGYPCRYADQFLVFRQACLRAEHQSGLPSVSSSRPRGALSAAIMLSLLAASLLVEASFATSLSTSTSPAFLWSGKRCEPPERIT